MKATTIITSIEQSKENNFDLIRLFAALQIMLVHYSNHVPGSSHFLSIALSSSRFFSGIAVLFTISGFLIFASFDKHPDLKNYFKNRFLRIFPGLWVCLLFTIGILTVFGYINSANIFSKQFLSWLVTQSSFLQFYTPPMLRGFGVGTPNGALWTIPVEISFYIIVPVLFWIFKKTRNNRNVWLILLIALSVAYNVCYQQYKFQNERSNLVKLMGVNLAPYLFYFLLGAITYINWERIGKWYKNKGLFWLAAYLLYFMIFSVWLKKFELTYWTNFYHFIAIVLLSQTTIAMAFTYRSLSTKILRHNDISYGIYGYHMPVINLLLTLGYDGQNYTFFIALASVIALAFLSWRFVERQALLQKRKTINKELSTNRNQLGYL